MKIAVLVGDGMADYPIEELDNRTPLDVAKTPNLDSIAKEGISGTSLTIPKGLKPGSDVGILSVLGYNPSKYYTGRAPLEAASMKIDLKDSELAFRCNLVTAEDDKLVDYSAGHISSKEAKVLIEEVNKKLGTKDIRFYPGVSYRHLMVVDQKGSDTLRDISVENLDCTPPHDITGKEINPHLPKGKGADFLISLMERSRAILETHDINNVRIDLGENPGNMIWLWGGGKRPQLTSFKENYGVTGGLISAVDLVKGIGYLTGLNVLDVPGITGYYDTDYNAKATYAIEELKRNDFVFVHLESIDEAGHNKHLREKIAAIEKFDKYIVGPILAHMRASGDYRIMVMPDHYTPVALGKHTPEKVPVTMCGSNIEPDDVEVFNENTAEQGSLNVELASDLMQYLIKQTI